MIFGGGFDSEFLWAYMKDIEGLEVVGGNEVRYIVGVWELDAGLLNFEVEVTLFSCAWLKCCFFKGFFPN